MRAIIIKAGDTIEAVTVVNDDDAQAVVMQLIEQINAGPIEAHDYTVHEYAVDPTQTVLDYCIPR